VTGKRLLDIAVAALGLILLLPLFAALAVAIRLSLGSPVLFRQLRPGYRERPFVMYKFRTMREAVGSLGRPLPDAERIHPLGVLLRRASLDELPELWNVLRGDMSLVGPRPLLTEYVPLYTSTQRRRHEVPPGITGWAQIHGRNNISWEQKFDYDVWYVDHPGFWLDLKILALTVKQVVLRDGINRDGHVTTPYFLGIDMDTEHDS
jgi:lipopolysaccharide/colanic/teichoic acid biosynthesis glycosyltransferase